MVSFFPGFFDMVKVWGHLHCIEEKNVYLDGNNKYYVSNMHRCMRLKKMFWVNDVLCNSVRYDILSAAILQKDEEVLINLKVTDNSFSIVLALIPTLY